MQSVNVYLRDGKYFVSVIHGSGGGDPCIDAGPVAVVEQTAGASELGAVVLSQLNLSRKDLPWPTDWKKVTEPLLSAAGVKTWATFAKRAANARVDRKEKMVVVNGSKRDEKNAFVFEPTKLRELNAPGAVELGEALVGVLS